jgi:type II secretory pathway pseudopilin PulG
MVLVKQKGSPHGEAGQILLVVVLVVIVATTIGLSLASRSITSLRTSTEEAESQKALAAAEAGVERLIENSAPTAENAYGNLANNTNYSAVATPLSATTFLMNGGNSVPKDEGADLWFTAYSSDPASSFLNPWSGNITIYWGDDPSTPCSNPALEIIIVTGSKSNPVSKRYVYDPCPSRQSGNHFDTPSVPSGGKTMPPDNRKLYYSSGNVPISITNGLIARVVPLYGSTSVGIEASSALPLQGYVINSTGTSGGANRKIRVFKGYPQTYLPYLSYGLFVTADK